MMEVKRIYKIASFFAGVGGIDLGFMQTGRCQVVYANEFDPYAQMTYRLNYPLVNLDSQDICNVNPSDIDNKIDIIVGGFPCQAFSVAGHRKGFLDSRGNLYFELLKMIQYHRPKAIFIENVKGLVTHNKGESFKIIKESLKQLGYFVTWKVMNTATIGNLPQNRERVYLIALRDIKAFHYFYFPSIVPLTKNLEEVIDFNTKVADKYYYINHAIYDQLKDKITRKDRIYQWRRRYVRENKAGLVPTLTANMGTGGHNVPLILTKHGIRKLTPRETFNIQGYPDSFRLPPILDRHLYKQAGNSVSVPVIKRIAERLLFALILSDYPIV